MNPTGAFSILPESWRENYGSGTFPEILDLYRRQVEAKQKSRLIIKRSEIRWDGRHPQARSAALVDPRNGFANSLVNVGLSEIAPNSHTGRHRHGEAIVYIVKGRGYSIIADQRVDWEEGDCLYVPPDTYHQHFNPDPSQPALYLRVVPGPIMLNLLSVLAALNVGPAYNVEQSQAYTQFSGDREAATAHMRGD